MNNCYTINRFVYIFWVMAFFTSCNKDHSTIDPGKHLHMPNFSEISIVGSSNILNNHSENIFNEQSFKKKAGSPLMGSNPRRKVGRVEVTDRSQWDDPGQVGFTIKGVADEFIMTPDWLGKLDVFHLGSIIQGNSIQDLSFIPLSERNGDYEAKPVSVSVSFPAKTVTGSFMPDVMSSTEFFSTLMKNNKMTSMQNSAFQYEIEEFTYFNELKTVFGADVDIKAIFFKSGSSGSNSSEQISGNSGLVATFTQKNFSVDMSIPEEGLELYDKLNVASGVSPVYINSVMYGAKGILLVESSVESNVLKSTFDKVFSVMGGLIDGSKQLTTEEKQIIANSQIQMAFMGTGGAVVKKLASLDELIGVIKKGVQFSPLTPGVPISYKMRTLLGNKTVQNRFNFRIPIKPFYGKNVIQVESGVSNMYAMFFADKNLKVPVIVPENIAIRLRHIQYVREGNPREGFGVVKYIDDENIYNKDKSSKFFLSQTSFPRTNINDGAGKFLIDSESGSYKVIYDKN